MPNCTLVPQLSNKMSDIVFHPFSKLFSILSHPITSYQPIFHVLSGLLARIYNFHLVCLHSIVDISSISNALKFSQQQTTQNNVLLLISAVRKTYASPRTPNPHSCGHNLTFSTHRTLNSALSRRLSLYRNKTTISSHNSVL